jgi:hypothetical protein
MALLSKEQILAANAHLKTVDVALPRLGGEARLRELSGPESVLFQGAVKKHVAAGGQPEEMGFPLIAKTWIGEDGSLLFPGEDGEAQVRGLGLAKEDLEALATAAIELNGFDTEAVERAEGNSEPTPSGSTSSS